jgi:hypothetical protein
LLILINTWWIVQIMKLLRMQSPPVSYHYPSWVQTFFSTLFSNTLNLFSSI